MLTKMYLTNFLSFKKRTEFDFTASKYSILESTNVSKKGILKGASFIGPNASGKTNALRGVSFLIKMIKGEGTKVSNYRCNFSVSEIISAEYEFLFEDIKVVYLIEYNIDSNEISEDLRIDGERYLKREGNVGTLKIGENWSTDDNLDSQTLFLRTASFNTGRFPQVPALRQFMDFLMNSYVVDGYSFEAHNGRNIKKFAEEFGVEKINAYLSDFNYDFFIEYGSKSEGEGLVLTVNQAPINQDNKVIFFKRRSYPIPTLFFAESRGNQVFADLLPNLIDVIEKPGMLVYDEFGNSLHNRLAEKVIRFFMERASNSQLFITSQNTNLISNSVYRPDQLNLITFEGKKGSKVERLSQYKPREAQNLEKMYLGGMFEGLPVYEKLYNK